MKIWLAVFSTFGLLLVAIATRADDKPADFKFDPKSIEGNWEGTLNVDIVKLRLVYKIAKNAQGGFAGTFDSIDQGAKNIKLDEVTLDERKVHFAHKTGKSVYEGNLNEAGTEIVGEFRQAGLKLPLTLKRVAQVTELKRPQEPKKPYPYDEQEVTIENARAGVKLACTLTLPRGTPPQGGWPAAILITGSGPQDRDESLLGHKPFLVLADYLTRRGVAVLRYDDRGTAKSTGEFVTATSLDFADDTRAVIEFVKNRREINGKQIGLIGHSEGGLIAPMIAAKSKDIAFIVMLAGPGLVGEEILYLQGQAIMKAMNMPAEKLAEQRALQKRMFDMVKQEKDNAAAEKKLKEIMDAEFAKLSEAEKKAAGGMLEAAGARAKMVLTPWFRYFLTYDPRPTLMQVQCPVLALIGEKDLQVPPKENIPAIEQALKAGGNRDYLVKELPSLNHLFQTCKTGAVSEYGEIEETIAPAALELMAEWIVKRTTKAIP
jgi:uncharacterized protein